MRRSATGRRVWSADQQNPPKIGRFARDRRTGPDDRINRGPDEAGASTTLRSVVERSAWTRRMHTQPLRERGQIEACSRGVSSSHRPSWRFGLSGLHFEQNATRQYGDDKVAKRSSASPSLQSSETSTDQKTQSMARSEATAAGRGRAGNEHLERTSDRREPPAACVRRPGRLNRGALAGLENRGWL